MEHARSGAGARIAMGVVVWGQQTRGQGGSFHSAFAPCSCGPGRWTTPSNTRCDPGARGSPSALSAPHGASFWRPRGAHRLLGVLDLGCRSLLVPCLGQPPNAWGEKARHVVPLPGGRGFSAASGVASAARFPADRAIPLACWPNSMAEFPPRPPWHCRAFWGGASLGAPATSPGGWGAFVSTAGCEVRWTPRGARAFSPGVLSSHPSVGTILAGAASESGGRAPNLWGECLQPSATPRPPSSGWGPSSPASSWNQNTLDGSPFHKLPPPPPSTLQRFPAPT